jgi:hypothetical protein
MCEGWKLSDNTALAALRPRPRIKVVKPGH